MRNAVIIIIVILISFADKSLAQSSELEALIKKYENRDGAMVFELSFQMAKEFVKNDSLFFKLMLNHKETYKDWVDDLQYKVFTAHRAEDDWVEKEMYTSFYDALKDLMLERSKKMAGYPEYYELSTMMTEELQRIKVRFIE